MSFVPAPYRVPAEDIFRPSKVMAEAGCGDWCTVWFIQPVMGEPKVHVRHRGSVEMKGPQFDETKEIDLFPMWWEAFSRPEVVDEQIRDLGDWARGHHGGQE